MNWLEILKMPRESYPGSDFKSSEEYHRGTKKQRAAYHGRMKFAARTNLGILQGQASGSLSDADPVVDEHPVNQEIDRLQEMARFHERQYQRITLERNLEDFFSLEEENNRVKMIPQTTRTGSKIVHKEIPQEEYDELNDEQKIRYHSRLHHKYRNEGNEKLKKFHNAMRTRLLDKRNLPTFSSFREGIYQQFSSYGEQHTKEEYLQMSDEDKGRYHAKMATRVKKDGDRKLSNWHKNMYNRIVRGSKLPNYHSPEHQQEESQ